MSEHVKVDKILESIAVRGARSNTTVVIRMQVPRYQLLAIDPEQGASIIRKLVDDAIKTLQLVVDNKAYSPEKAVKSAITKLVFARIAIEFLRNTKWIETRQKAEQILAHLGVDILNLLGVEEQ